MHQRHFLLISILVFGFFFPAYGQNPVNDNCDNPMPLCFNEWIKGSNYNATTQICDQCSDWSSDNGCFELQNTVWFNFLTNERGGSATIKIKNIQCNGDTNNAYYNQLEAVVIKADTNCIHTSYQFISNCQHSENVITFDIPNLSPDQEYMLVVDGKTNPIDSSTLPASCEFEVAAYGNAIDPLVDAGPDVFTAPNVDAPLSGSGYGVPSWYPNDNITNPSIFNPSVFLDINTLFELTITQEIGCTFTDEVMVYVQVPLEVFNTITPNGDGFNDTWKIINIESYPYCKISVFSRWGQRLYYSIGYAENKQWDGTYNGKELPSGTYYYVIETSSNIGESTYSGYINLIR